MATVRLLAKIGAHNLIDDVARTAPDVIDIDRDQNLLAQFRLENCAI